MKCSVHIAGLAVGMSLSLVWMVLLRFCAGVMAWAAILSVNIFCAVCTMLAFLKVPHKPKCSLHPSSLHRPVAASLVSALHPTMGVHDHRVLWSNSESVSVSNCQLPDFVAQGVVAASLNMPCWSNAPHVSLWNSITPDNLVMYYGCIMSLFALVKS